MLEGSDELTLEKYLRIKISEKHKRYDALRELYYEIMNEKVALLDPNPPKSFMQYLVRLDYVAWLWLIIVTVLVTNLLIISGSVVDVLIYLRHVLGSVYILFIPGYTTARLIYLGSRNVNELESLVISVGLSIAIVTLASAIINFTPWGLRPWSVSLTIAAYVIIASMAACYLEYRTQLGTAQH